MADYTPTTEEVRNRYLSEVFTEDEAEFDRWLAEHDRVVKSKAWAEGFAEGKWVSNPYREETE